MPVTSPPTIFINAIIIPLHHLLQIYWHHPLPHKNPLLLNFRLLLRASLSLMIPAFKSASILICLPGMASSVNLAATSATLSAPFVITQKLYYHNNHKYNKSNQRIPLNYKISERLMTFPAYPFIKISLVDDMLSES